MSKAATGAEQTRLAVEQLRETRGVVTARLQQVRSELPGDAEKQMKRTEAIIFSMTIAERTKPDILKASRKRRIAAGAGVQVQEVNRLLKQFEQMRDMMKSMQKGGLAKLMKKMGGGGKGGFPGGGMPPGGGFPGM